MFLITQWDARDVSTSTARVNPQLWTAHALKSSTCYHLSSTGRQEKHIYVVFLPVKCIPWIPSTTRLSISTCKTFIPVVALVQHFPLCMWTQEKMQFRYPNNLIWIFLYSTNTFPINTMQPSVVDVINDLMLLFLLRSVYFFMKIKFSFY